MGQWSGGLATLPLCSDTHRRRHIGSIPLGIPLSHELISLAVLAIVFLVATVRGVNMGALALISAFIVE